MKILHVLNHFLPHQVAGTEVYAYALISELQQLGVECKVLIPHYGKTYNAAYVHEGIEVLQYAEPSVVDRALIMGKRQPDGLPAFASIVQAEQPNIVHFHELAGSNGITLHHVQTAKALGYKTVMTFHLAGYSCKTGNMLYKDSVPCDGKIQIAKCSSCFLHTKGMSGFKTKITANAASLLYQLGYNTTAWNNSLGTALATNFLIQQKQHELDQLAAACDVLVPITNWYQQVLLVNGIHPDKIVLIPQALKSSIHQSQQITKSGKSPVPSESLSDCALKLVFVGRIAHFKGVHLLVEALSNLPQSAISLDIYGQPNEADYYQRCLTQSAHLPNVQWKGTLPSNAVVATLARYDVLCLPSTFSEMSPLVIQEAFAAGIPVLASDVAGNAEQIQHGHNGWLFAFKNSHALQQQLARLIDNPSLVQAAKLHVPQPRQFREVAAAYDAVYRKLVE